ncbi:hypothetical protein CC1G_13705 [Coprinopsis cinerea okayama7|uniref:Uncharacterized protein n=1 Tax=Coprinopsis cinerea (strain Okayama-7 / 130 / ATCC MYA-4618 / FGSC 9003) TaxID=240176 RepID=D6RK42_COPC7|nr:hypothetical protein CC1G_13705 [Coprinopsis cinerea okayama7\|eukprot:XP_002912172.1 hypothetical protein CC1G_13705 [Coprinopsis cinerea okayama7\
MSFLRPDRLISTVAQNSAWSNNANGEPGKPQHTPDFGRERASRGGVHLQDNLWSKSLSTVAPGLLIPCKYELVRNGDTLEKQQDILANLTVSRSPSRNEALAYIYNVAEFYKEKITSKGASRKVSDAMQVVMEELESNGLHIPHERFSGDLEPPIRAEEVLDFARHACGDGLALIAELRGQSS